MTVIRCLTPSLLLLELLVLSLPLSCAFLVGNIHRRTPPSRYAFTSLVKFASSSTTTTTTTTSTSTTKTSSSSIDEVDCLTGPFEPRQLQGYWGRRPVLIRQAFDADSLCQNEIWPTWSDIIDLATASDDPDELESSSAARLIQHIPGQLESFDMQLGPFDESELNALRSSSDDDDDDNDRKWTLVVNDVDRNVPCLADWMDQEFAFLPRWRRDDAQFSLAMQQGGIGPHVDSYDVFLVQAAGQRTWRVGHDTWTVEREMQALIPDLSVRILQQQQQMSNETASAATSATSFTLEPGDMLYLPPRYMHCGTAESDDCMTLSVGCRAPSAAELFGRAAQVAVESDQVSAVQRYTDTNLEQLVSTTLPGKVAHAGPSLTTNVKESMKELLLDAVKGILDDELQWDEVVGKIVTEPKRFSDNAIVAYDEIVMEGEDYAEYWGETAGEALQQVGSGQGVIRRAEGVSFATSVVKDKQGQKIDRLFCSGEMFEIANDTTAAAIFEKIERGHSLRANELSNASDPLLRLLENLVAEGFLYPNDDEDEES
jgi:50S ribosomal protein L16 3-hydroxylase